MVSSHLRRIYYFFPFTVFSVCSVVENARSGFYRLLLFMDFAAAR